MSATVHCEYRVIGADWTPAGLPCDRPVTHMLPPSGSAYPAAHFCAKHAAAWDRLEGDSMWGKAQRYTP